MSTGSTNRGSAEKVRLLQHAVCYASQAQKSDFLFDLRERKYETRAYLNLW